MNKCSRADNCWFSHEIPLSVKQNRTVITAAETFIKNQKHNAGIRHPFPGNDVTAVSARATPCYSNRDIMPPTHDQQGNVHQQDREHFQNNVHQQHQNMLQQQFNGPPSQSNNQMSEPNYNQSTTFAQNATFRDHASGNTYLNASQMDNPSFNDYSLPPPPTTHHENPFLEDTRRIRQGQNQFLVQAPTTTFNHPNPQLIPPYHPFPVMAC